MVYVLLHRTLVTLNSNDKCFLCIPENKLSLFWQRAHIRCPPFTPLKISYPGTRTLLRSRKNFNISSMELILVVMPKSLQRMHKISWKKKATCNENLIEQTQWKRKKKIHSQTTPIRLLSSSSAEDVENLNTKGVAYFLNILEIRR